MGVPRFRITAFYNGLSSFKTAFPSLHDANVEWEEQKDVDDTSKRSRRKMGFRRGNFNRGLIQCGNQKCWEGGYAIDRLIDEMILLNETERSGVLYCGGRELNDDAKRSVRCRHRITFSVRLNDQPQKQQPLVKNVREKQPQPGSRPRNRQRRSSRSRRPAAA